MLWPLFIGYYDVEKLTEARTWCAEGVRRFPDDYRFTECRLWSLTMPGVTPNVPEAWCLVDAVTKLTPEGGCRLWCRLEAGKVRLLNRGSREIARSVNSLAEWCRFSALLTGA